MKHSKALVLIVFSFLSPAINSDDDAFNNFGLSKCSFESLAQRLSPRSHWTAVDSGLKFHTRETFYVSLAKEALKWNPLNGTCSNLHIRTENSTNSYEDPSFRVQLLNNFVFQLMDGSRVKAEDIRDIPHLISIRPLVDRIFSDPFITWLQSVDHDQRRRILEVLEGVPLVGDSGDFVEDLYHFAKIENRVQELNEMKLKLHSGEIFLDFVEAEEEPDFFDKHLYISREIKRNSFRQLAKTFIENEYHQLKINTTVAFEFWWKYNAFWGGKSITELYLAITRGEKDATAIAAIFLAAGILQGIADFHLTEKFLTSMFKTLDWKVFSKWFGTGTQILNIGMSIWGGVNDIRSIASGNLDALALAATIVSLTNNVLAIVFSAISIYILFAVSSANPAGLILAGIGLAVAIILKLVQELLMAFSKRKQINAAIDSIDSQIAMSDYEKELMRKNGGQPPDYLVNLFQMKLLNDALIDSAFSFLVESKDFDRYVFPAMSSTGVGDPDFFMNNEAYLNESMTDMHVERWTPDGTWRFVCDGGLKAVDLFECAPRNMGTGGSLYRKGRPCVNAMGVRYTHNRTKQRTLIDLKNGTDIAAGTLDNENVFVVGSGRKTYKGGRVDDTFLLEQSVTGLLDGGEGDNALVLSSNMTHPRISVNLTADIVNFGNQVQVTLENIQVLVTRENRTDTVTTGCNTKSIFSNGNDDIEIPSLQSCNYTLAISGGNNTNVRNEATLGSFYYFVADNVSNFNVDILHNENAQHFVKLNYDVKEFKDIKLNEERYILFESSKGGRATFQMQPLNRDDYFYSNPIFVAEDNSTIRVDKYGKTTVVYKVTKQQSQLEVVHIGQSVLFLEENVADVIGWDGNDTFILENNVFSGRIDGRGGDNHISLGAEYHPNTRIIFNANGSVEVGSTKIISFINVTQFSGRPGQKEEFYCQCDTLFVNTEGSTIGQEDVVYVANDEQCTYELTVRMAANSKLLNRASLGKFMYSVPFEPNIDFEIESAANLSHAIIFEFGARQIQNGTVQSDFTFFIENATGIKMYFPIERLETDPNNTESELGEFYSGPTYLTNDTAIMTIGVNGLFHFMFNITEEEDVVEGALFAENIFFIKNDTGLTEGGDVDDIFILYKTDFRGSLDGGKGVDRLVLDQNYTIGDRVTIDLREIETGGQMRLVNINEVIGRNGTPEWFLCGCRTTLVDGLEGREGAVDIVEVPDNVDCDYDMQIIVRNHTEIRNRADEGHFIFHIVEQQGFFDFITGNSPKLDQTAFFPLTQSNISNVTFDEERTVVTFKTKWNTSLEFKLLELNEEEESTGFYESPRLVSQDLIDFKVTNEGHMLAIFTVFNDSSKEGFPFLRNMFLVNNGTSNIVGGDLDDTFIYTGSINVMSKCFGGQGSNTLGIHDRVEGRVKIVGNSSFSDTGINADLFSSTIIYHNVSAIYGRNATGDNIQADCYTHLINGNGGASSSDQDAIIIPNLRCNYTDRLTIAIHNHTRVLNEANNGYFMYAMMENSSFSVDCTPKTGGSSYHAFSLQLGTINSVRHFHVNKTDDCSITVETKNDIELVYSLRNSIPCTFPSLLFGEELLEVSFSSLGTIRGSLPALGNDTIEELIAKWLPIATALNMTVSLFNNATDEMVIINRMAQDALWSSPHHRTHLVGNKIENLFIIGVGNETLIPDVQIYSMSNSSNLVDMSQLVKPVRQSRLRGDQNSFYIPSIVKVGQNLEMQVENTDATFPVNITLINFEEYVKNMTFLLDESPMHLKKDELTELWRMVPTPIPFNQSLMIVDEASFEEGTELIVNHNMGNEHNILYQGNDLVITNIFNSTEEDFFMMVFNEFFTESASRSKVRNRRRESDRPLPANVYLNVKGSSVVLDRIDGAETEDILQVLLDERQKLDDKVFGFSCKEAGTFPDPRRCEVYHECILINSVDFVHYEFTCPRGTVFCVAQSSCGYESTCPCPA